MQDKARVRSNEWWSGRSFQRRKSERHAAIEVMRVLVVYLEERERERERGCSDRGDESVCETDALVVTHRCRR